MNKKHKNKHKNHIQHQHKHSHKPSAIYRDTGKPRPRRFIALFVTVLAFAGVGSYQVYQSFAVSNTYGFIAIYLSDIHNGVPVRNTLVRVYPTGEGSGTCRNGGYNAPDYNAGVTNNEGLVLFWCQGSTTISSESGTVAPYQTASYGFSIEGATFRHDTNHGGLIVVTNSSGDLPTAPGNVVTIRTDKDCPQEGGYNCYYPNGAWQSVHYPMQRDRDGDGVFDHFDECPPKIYGAAGSGCLLPPPGPNPSPSPSQPTSTSTPSRGTGTRAPARKPTAPQATPDTSAPSLPIDFKAEQSGNEVKLSWSASTDNVGVASYRLERSTDQVNWTQLGGDIADTFFNDDSFTYETKNYYQLAAYDAAGNGSEYIQLDITTGKFEGNAKLGEGFSITSDDGLVKVEFEPDSFNTEPFCTVFKTDEHQEKLDKIAVGPYKIECEDKDGNIITSFKKAAKVSVSRSEGVNISKVEIYRLNTKPNEIIISTINEQGDVLNFDIEQAIVFAGSQKSSSKWWIWPIILLILAIAAFGVRYLLHWRSSQYQAVDNYSNAAQYYNNSGLTIQPTNQPGAEQPPPAYQPPTQAFPETERPPENPPHKSNKYPWT